MEPRERAMEEAMRRCEKLEKEIDSLRISSTWKATLLRLVHSELSFLRRFELSLSEQEEGHHLDLTHSNASLSVNVGHLEAVVHILQQPFITGVSRVCKPIRFSPSPEKKHLQKDSGRIYVDIVCCLNGKPVWFVISDRNPKYISWSESTTNKTGLKTRIHSLVKAATSSEMLSPYSIILFFSNGLDNIVHQNLKQEFGASDIDLDFDFPNIEELEEEEDGWVNILLPRFHHKACILEIVIKPSTSTARREGTLLESYTFLPDHSDPFSALVSEMKLGSNDIEPGNHSDARLVNFDTTALVAIVSGISNKGIDKLLATPEEILRDKFKGNYVFVLSQVDSEIEAPVIVGLTNVLAGKEGIICESVCKEFEELVSMYGGPNEKLRATRLLKCLKHVPDSPSSRVMSLPTTRKLALKNKVVFGTGDHWQAPTVTANAAFVRAVSQTGMSLFCIEHRPRALVGD